MRPNVVTEAGLSTRLCQWWASVPFITSGVVILCGLIYLVCLLSGYDSFIEICFLPSEVVSRFQVYRIYTSVLFHGSLLHVLFNMLALVPLVVAHIPLYPYPFLMNECAIGFSGIIFSMIVIETNLSGVQSRSVFGLFSVPAKWYAWILLVLFQLLATNVSLLGHLCGILSGFAYTYGLFNYLLPGPSFYYSIESSSLLSACIRRPGFILCTGGTTYGQLPMFSNATTASSGLSPGNIWRNLSSWMPQREVSTSQPAQDSRFPGRGMTLGSARSHSATTADSDISLQARLLDNSAPDHPLETAPPSTEPRASNGRHLTVDSESIALLAAQNQGVDNFEEELKKLVAMGFEKTQAEVALAAADGDPSVAIEILMSQQG
ncbi:rhomboid-like protein 15 isoform X2 [Phoenix dactylifera]|uniref:Rhomboid-like protein 15 isoform X2 n=1 Tax=Phoenix dactylifera TaxID=42345 RepID=A0A8B9A5Q2_PHODC|nr:rhomboid-like protein 15 isoform X2 [Phoenix dactylifera]